MITLLHTRQKNNVRIIFTCGRFACTYRMRLTLRELRELLQFEITLNEIDIGKLATRASKGKGLVIQGSRDDSKIIAITKDEFQRPKVVGGAHLQYWGYTKSWRVISLWADNASAAFYVLAGALEKYKCIVPDHSVSPAAQAVIKHYFEEHKDDPSRVSQNYDFESRTPNEEEPDFLKAAYLGPVGFDLSSALAAGKQISRSKQDEDNVAQQNAEKWNSSFNDDIKTGRDNFLQLLKSGVDAASLLTTLDFAFDDGGEREARALAFLQKYHTSIEQKVQASKYSITKTRWERYFRPRLQA